jgi:hypothetical protein
MFGRPTQHTNVLLSDLPRGLGNWIEGFETIAGARGRPHRFGEETGIPDLYFVGIKHRPAGGLRQITLAVPQVARSLRAVVGASAALDRAWEATAA